MPHSQLLQDLQQILAGANIDNFIQKVKVTGIAESAGVIMEILEKEKMTVSWQGLAGVWRMVMALGAGWPANRAELTLVHCTTLVEETANQLQNVSVDRDNLMTARLMVCLFTGINERMKMQDNSWSLIPVTKALKLFSGKNREQNLKPIMDEVVKLDQRIEAVMVLSQPAEHSTEITVPVVPLETSADLQAVVTELTGQMMARQLAFSAFAEKLSPSGLEPEGYDQLLDNLSLLKDQLNGYLSLLAGMEDVIQRHMEDSENISELTAFGDAIDTKMAGGNVIPFDQRRADAFGLSKAQQDAWRQRAHIDYEAGLTPSSLFNRAREAAATVHSVPLIGSASKKLSSMLRVFPGSQTVMGSTLSHGEVMEIGRAPED